MNIPIVRPFFTLYSTLKAKCFIVSMSQTGQLVTKVHSIQNKAYKFIDEAFIMFESANDIELALANVTKNNNKIRNKQIRIFRSSEEQFKMYCDIGTIKKLSSCLKINRSESVGEIP